MLWLLPESLVFRHPSPFKEEGKLSNIKKHVLDVKKRFSTGLSHGQIKLGMFKHAHELETSG